MIENIFLSLSILVLVFASSFAFCLPLMAITKDRAIGLRYAIPFSISVEIILGYFYYCLGIMPYFPITYLLVVVVSSILAYRKLPLVNKKKLKVDRLTAFALILVLAVVFYTRYFDSFKFIGPGGNDSYYHLNYIREIIGRGYLSNGYYAPGFHLFFAPIAELIPLSKLYRFAGPAIGMVTVISIVLFLKDYLKNKIILVFLLALLAFPVFNQFNLQTIYFFSTALTFIYFASFIFLSLEGNNRQLRISKWLFLLFCAALAVTVPYFFVSLLPAFLLTLIVMSIFRNKFGKLYLHHLALANLLLFVGFMLSFGHVFLQSNILGRYYGFPGIRVATTSISKPAETSGVTGKVTEDAITGPTVITTTNNELASRLKLPSFIINNSYLKPMMGTGVDLIRIKDVRSVRSILGLGSYLWIFFSFLMLLYAIKKKNSLLLIVATLSIFFGFSTQTGFLEMSFYRGRSGWYLLMLSVFGVVLAVDQAYSRRAFRLLLVGSIAISILGIFFPPKFYRSYYDNEFLIASQIAKEMKGKPVTLIANNYKLDIVSDDLVVKKLEPGNLGSENAFLIIENQLFQTNPVVFLGGTSINENQSEFDREYRLANEVLIKENKSVMESEDFKHFKEYYKDDDFTVYKSVSAN